MRMPFVHPLTLIQWGLIFSLLALSNVALAKDLTLQSTAAYSDLNKAQFIAELYTPSSDTDPLSLLEGNTPFEMRVSIEARYISSRSFRRTWQEGAAINNSPERLQPLNSTLASFSNLFKGRLLKGDDFRVRYTGKGHSIVMLNGITLQSIPNSQFAPLLLSCWLGDVPLSARFKEDLLSGEENKSVAIRKQVLNYTKDRQVTIENWLDPAPAVSVLAAPQITPTTVEPQPPVIQKQLKAVETFTAQPKAAKKIPPEQPKATPVKVTAIAKKKTLPPKTAPKKTAVVKTVKPSKVKAPASKAVANVNKPVAKTAQVNAQQTADPRPSEQSEEDILVEETEEVLTLRQNYYKQLTRHLQNFKTIPFMAFQRKWKGEVRLLVVIDRKGSVIEHRFIEEDRRKVFNDQALEALKRADPFPQIPSELSESRFSFSVPLQYSLN